MSNEETPPEDTESTETYQQPSTPPSRIGHYRILQKIGEGGMGEVYLAEQDDPRRKVALKIIKWGMDTKQVMARFEAERQALALMDHPNIAKVFDAGATEQGRPYFVMEYVKGVPITEHCDRQRLTTKERLELLMQVCEGVQHAHQKAVIHRDIKPSNILVSIQDGNAVPKIIDFGVAKATAQRLTERTVYTELGQLIGTPEYMSPEQAEMTAQDVDTRTDVYSLGVVLYQLLAGALPFESASLRLAGFDEIRRKIREDEPSKPSTRLSTLGGEASTEAARRRRTDISSLRKQLYGDLDWITMKSLSKNRANRYGSPSELAADILRHFKNEAVVAGPPSFGYQASKFVKRHKAAVAVGVLVGIAAFVGITGLAFGIAERNYQNYFTRAINLKIWLGKYVDWENTSEFEYVLALFDVDSSGSTVSARGLLDRAVDNLPSDLGSAPPSVEDVLTVSWRANLLGTLYMKLGMYEDAEPLLQRALSIRMNHLGPNNSSILQSFETCAEFYRRIGRTQLAEEMRTNAARIRDRPIMRRSAIPYDDPSSLDWNDPRFDGMKREIRKILETPQ